MLRRILVSAILVACNIDDGTSSYVRTGGDPPAEEDEGGACEAPSLQIQNDSGFTLATAEVGTCDSMAGPTRSILEQALGPGDSFTAELPAPDCYFVVITEASGCAIETPLQTGPLDACERHTLRVTDDLFLCPSGP